MQRLTVAVVSLAMLAGCAKESQESPLNETKAAVQPNKSPAKAASETRIESTEQLVVVNKPQPEKTNQDHPQPNKTQPKPKKPKSNRLDDKTFDDLKFDIEPDAPYDRSLLTEDIEAMDGQRIRIRGYILPTAQSRGIKQFVLVRDNMECCFGPGAALYDCILVEMAEGKSTEFSIYPVSVEGEFVIEEFTIDGRTFACFKMHGEAVK